MKPRPEGPPPVKPKRPERRPTLAQWLASAFVPKVHYSTRDRPTEEGKGHWYVMACGRVLHPSDRYQSNLQILVTCRTCLRSDAWRFGR